MLLKNNLTMEDVEKIAKRVEKLSSRDNVFTGRYQIYLKN